MDNAKKAKRLGLLGLALCGICCALPVMGAAIGFASLTAFAAYLEKIGFSIAGLSAFFVWYAWYSKRKEAKTMKLCSCNTNCGCKTGSVA